MGVINFLPIQEGTGDPSPMNVRPISGYQLAVGKNLFIPWMNGYYSPSSGKMTGTGVSTDITSKPVYAKAGTVFTLSQVHPSYAYSFEEWSIYPQNTSDMIPDNLLTRSSNATGGSRTYTVQNNCYITFRAYRAQGTDVETEKIQVELGSTATEYESPFKTIYGGYLDIGNSELVEEYGFKEFTGSEGYNWKTYSTEVIYTTNSVVPNVNLLTGSTSAIKGVCSHVKTLANDNIHNTYLDRPANNSDGVEFRQVVSYWGLSEQSTTELDDYLQNEYEADHPVQVCYYLATPIHHSLNSAQLAFAMDELGVRKSSMLESRRRIMLGSPHLETTTAPIASFNTDMKADVKSLKVHFAPVQEGTGDPSPTNVRPITGRSGLNTWRTGRNVCHIVGYSASTLNVGGNRSSIGSYGTSLSTTSPERSVTITQTQWPEESNVSSYKNGYFVIAEDNLKFGKSYNVSFTVDVTNNPLNVSLSRLKVGSPAGGATTPRNVNVNRVEYTVQYRRHSTYTERRGWEVYNCGMSLTISDIVVTTADETDLSYEPYNGNGYPVDWSNDAGTVYGGYLDLINGELVAEWEKQTTTWGDIKRNERNATTGLDRGDIKFNSAIVVSHSPSDDGVNCMCSVLNVVYWQTGNRLPAHYFSGNYQGHGVTYMFLPDDLDSSTPIEVACKLATPIRYQLTPEQIKTLKGTNNIFADTNGDIEVTYWTH